MTSIIINSLYNQLFETPAIAVGHIIGWLAATMSIISFLPQSIKVIKTRTTKGISLGMFSIYILANLSWMLWAILSIIKLPDNNEYWNGIFSNLTVIIPNFLCTVITSLIVFMKMKNILMEYKENKFFVAPSNLKEYREIGNNFLDTYGNITNFDGYVKNRKYHLTRNINCAKFKNKIRTIK